MPCSLPNSKRNHTDLYALERCDQDLQNGTIIIKNGAYFDPQEDRSWTGPDQSCPVLCILQKQKDRDCWKDRTASKSKDRDQDRCGTRTAQDRGPVQGQDRSCLRSSHDRFEPAQDRSFTGPQDTTRESEAYLELNPQRYMMRMALCTCI